MPQPIDFYFDFSSPYGYIAAEQINHLAQHYGRAVNWRPILLGAVFQKTGVPPLIEVPLKGDYAKRDFRRSAAFFGIEYNDPPVFPIPSLVPARAFYWQHDQDPQRAVLLARALLRAYFVDGINISEVPHTIEVASRLGIDPDRLTTALGDPAVKARLKDETERAIALGVFGSPFFIVDGEPFWGSDRLPQLEKWLETGGWTYGEVPPAPPGI